MDYSQLIAITVIAEKAKPHFGDKCNNCGWCCLTELCGVSKGLGATSLPCKYMKTEGEKHYCSLAESEIVRESLSVGKGCDAMTQAERIAELKAPSRQR